MRQNRDMKVIIGNLLRLGVIISAALVLAGGIIYLLANGLHRTGFAQFVGARTDLRSIGGIVKAALALDGTGIIQLGVLVLIATPIARVIFSVYEFARERDRTYVAVTLIVLAVLIFSLLGGRIEGAPMKAHADQQRIKIFNAETGKVEEVEPIVKSDAEWKKILTPEQYRVTREKGTETAFTGKCDVGGAGGVYKCVDCGTDLFKVETKFESGTGWPSFWEPVSPLNIKEAPDDSFGMKRVEVFCARCGAHLGHVFNDGPPPTGKRYCINAVALVFKPMKSGGMKK